MRKIYLDWSDLQKLLDKEFSKALTDALLDNYIVLSSQHLVELFSGKDIQKVRARVSFLDSVKNKLWITINNELDVYEALEWLSQQAVRIDLDEVFFKKDYFLSAKRDAKTSYGPGDMSGFYEECLLDPDMETTFQHWRSQSLRQARVLAVDRKQIAAGKNEKLHDQMVSKRLNEKHFLLMGEAVFASFLLTGQLVKAFHFYPDSHRVELSGVAMTTDVMCEIMPYVSLFSELTISKGYSFARQDMSSKKFQAHASDMGDMIHLTAMPLVDIFTCDAFLFKHLQKCPTFSRFKGRVFTKSDTDFEARILNALK